MIYTFEGKQYYHIKEFADLTALTTQAIRYLCFSGNNARKLISMYDGSRLYILASELSEYPFMKGGHTPSLQGIYHYRETKEGTWERYRCDVCTEGKSYNHNENMLNMLTLEGK
jgi:hypothetical protein